MIFNNGRELFEISFDFRLGIPFEKKPEQIIFELLALKREGEALVLLQGNGFSWGKVLIESLDYEVEQVDPKGNPAVISGSVNVKEYVEI
jgi:phage protein U